METFTVATTGMYTDSVTGGRFSYVAGAVIPLTLAVRLGMPGAELPTPDNSIAQSLGDLDDVTITDPQEGDVLTYVADWSNS